LGVITGGGGRGRGELKSLGSAGLMGNMQWGDDVKKKLGLERAGGRCKGGDGRTACFRRGRWSGIDGGSRRDRSRDTEGVD
jgi:hypothetical protein